MGGARGLPGAGCRARGGGSPIQSLPAAHPEPAARLIPISPLPSSPHDRARATCLLSGVGHNQRASLPAPAVWLLRPLAVKPSPPLLPFPTLRPASALTTDSTGLSPASPFPAPVQVPQPRQTPRTASVTRGSKWADLDRCPGCATHWWCPHPRPQRSSGPADSPSPRAVGQLQGARGGRSGELALSPLRCRGAYAWPGCRLYWFMCPARRHGLPSVAYTARSSDLRPTHCRRRRKSTAL